MKKIILFATEKRDRVLDPFAGRGTTGIAALSLGRRFTGIDLYADNVAKATKNTSAAASLITGHAPRTV